METNWAADHLQTIRTLMERSAIYRRALAPIMTFVGGVGAAAAVVGSVLQIRTTQSFVLYWSAVAGVAVSGSFVLVRRQALKDSEPFWSPPTRRVAQALLPPFASGFLIAAAVVSKAAPVSEKTGVEAGMLWLPIAWVVLYGCALHAAGFFTPRGMKVLGWIFICGGCGVFAIGLPDRIGFVNYAHGIMGFFFGGLHLAYGIYLYFTEKGKNAA